MKNYDKEINEFKLAMSKASVRFVEAANSMQDFGDVLAAIPPYKRGWMWATDLWNYYYAKK